MPISPSSASGSRFTPAQPCDRGLSLELFRFKSPAVQVVAPAGAGGCRIISRQSLGVRRRCSRQLLWGNTTRAVGISPLD